MGSISRLPELLSWVTVRWSSNGSVSDGIIRSEGSEGFLRFPTSLGWTNAQPFGTLISRVPERAHGTAKDYPITNL